MSLALLLAKPNLAIADCFLATENNKIIKQSGDCKSRHTPCSTFKIAITERPRLQKCLSSMKEGDTLIVWRLDRLGRSMPHLISLIEGLKKNKISFKSICDGAIDTTTASGELIFNIFSSLAQFEKRLIQERTKAGLSAARARGKLGGRRPITANDPRIKTAKKMYADKTIEIREICKTLNISRASIYRWLGI